MIRLKSAGYQYNKEIDFIADGEDSSRRCLNITNKIANNRQQLQRRMVIAYVKIKNNANKSNRGNLNLYRNNSD